MVAKEKAQLSDVAADYILANTEAAAYVSFMEYPPMYADTRKTPIKDQGIGDYWKLMDGVKLRSSVGQPRLCKFLDALLFLRKREEGQRKARHLHHATTTGRHV